MRESAFFYKLGYKNSPSYGFQTHPLEQLICVKRLFIYQKSPI